MQSYWLAIMAVCLAAALGIWIALVFLADRSGSRRPQENWPHREVVGGTFEARRGGRQVMPGPNEPIVPEPRQGGGAPAEPAVGSGDPGPARSARELLPEQRAQPSAEREPAQRESGT